MKKYSRHHIYPKSRHRELRGKIPSNMLEKTIKMFHTKHEYWHLIFGNLTIDEIIELLIRVKSLIKNKGGKK